MRNPDRIETFLYEIGKLWKEKFPDWRFGQLMFNFFGVLGDPFYYEEDEFLVAFQAYCNRENPKEAVKQFREQKVDHEAVAKYKQELESFWEKFNSPEFQAQLKKTMDEIKELEKQETMGMPDEMSEVDDLK